MKYFFTLLTLSVTLTVNAQTVNIPDPNFKTALINAGVDINHDGEIQESEAAAVTTLDVSYKEATNITVQDLTGIKSFVNLQYLEARNHSLDSLNVSGMKFLRYLGASSSLILNYLNATGCDSLLDLDITGMDIRETLDVSGSRKLQSLTIGNIGKLLAAGCAGLKFIKSGSGVGVSSGIGSSLDVTGCTSLDYINLMESGITTLDLSTCISLTNFTVQASETILKYLNIKNGRKTTLSFLEPPPSYPVLNICADDFEVDNVKANLSVWAEFFPGKLNVNSYCSFFPGGKYNTIEGINRIDANNNGCDNADDPMPNVPVKITDNTGNSNIQYGNAAGSYTFYTAKGNYKITPYFPYPYFSISPSSANVIFDTANSLLNTKNFCILPNGTHNDLEISFLPAGFTRPGFDGYYSLFYKNRGTTTLSGNIVVNFDDDKMNFVSASENTTTQSTGQITWSYNNLKPFESRQINTRFYLLPPPVNNIDDTLTWLAAINPSANDETPYDNSFILPQRVVGSFDPNDKQCIEGSKLDISKIGNYLHYQIRFQNEGTDTAFNIVVADTLSDKLDWSSFELISSSHPCVVNINNNKVEFIFENIKLPYKSINEPASQGWVSFKIKPKPTVLVGDSLNNKAAIYFDFNLPVITNTATTIVSSASTTTPVKLEYFTANTERNSNVLKWKANCTSISAEFVIEKSSDGIHFNRVENITATALRCQLPFYYTDANVLPGKNFYRIKVIDADGKFYYSKILALGINKSGIQLQAVSNGVLCYSNIKQQAVQIKITSADGKLLHVQNRNITAGNGQLNLPVKNLAAGVYILSIVTSDSIISKRFIR